MAPKKQTPTQSSEIKQLHGIVFSMHIEKSQLDMKLTVHNVTATSLLKRMSPKRERKKAKAGECTWCSTRKTAQWRKGPTGPRSLCNRCGIEWAKQIKEESKQYNITQKEAERKLMTCYETTDRFRKFANDHL